MRLQFYNYKKLDNIVITFNFFLIFILFILSELPSMGYK
jgi:hypothetical protein